MIVSLVTSFVNQMTSLGAMTPNLDTAVLEKIPKINNILADSGIAVSK